MVEVLAYTVWEACCKAECDDCRKLSCEKHHMERACHQGYPCCDDDGDGAASDDDDD